MVDASPIVFQSGFSKMMSLAVIFTGDEPVSTETLESVLVAAWGVAPDSVEGLEIIARAAGGDEPLLDLSTAVAGLPDDLDYVFSGSLTMMSDSLDRLAG
ncbi:hypothetical protein [Agromyces sp. NPDC058110]|uniref:hypothetical protein n=1 Tax=Agromyces sp. NPDC058110 TaxID=3346345 RepID=UPI0036D91151